MILKRENSFTYVDFSLVVLEFEEVLAGLNDKSLTYLDVRNRTELQSDGQVAGSVNIPCNNSFELYFEWF